MSKVESTSSQAWRRHYVVLAYLSLFALAFIDNVRGPYFPSLLRELDLSDTQGAWFFAVTSFVAFWSSWYTRFLIEKLGSLFTLVAGLITAGVSAIGISVSTDLSELLLASALFGVGFGWISVAMNITVSEGAPLVWRRRVLSGLHSIYGLASMCAPLLAALFETFGWDWREGFRFVGLPALLVAAAVFIKARSRSSKALPPPAPVEALKGVHRRWALWLGFSVAVYLFGELSLSTRLVLHLVRSYEWSLAVSSLYLGGFFAGLFISRFSLLFYKPSLSVLSLMQICLGSSIVLFSLGLWVHPLFLCLCGLSMGPFVPAALEHLMQIFGRFQAQAVSYTMAFFSLVVVSLHFILGWTTEAWGIRSSLWWGPAGLLLSWLMYRVGLRVYRSQLDHLKAERIGIEF